MKTPKEYMIKNVFIKEATCFGRPPSSRIK
jgi:hypothetical protein